MTKGRQQLVQDHFRAQLLAKEAQAQAQLSTTYKHVLATIQAHLTSLYKQISDAQAGGNKVPVSFLYEKNRLLSTKKIIQREISQFAGHAQQLTLQLQHEGIVLGLQSSTAQLEATVPVSYRYEFGTPSTRALEELVGSLQDGTPLSDYFAKFGTEAADAAGKALIDGLALGNNPRQVASKIENALNDVSRNSALVTARQAMLTPYKTAALENYRANSDVIDQWRWVADKSGRTCAVCLAMDGTLHDTSEDMESHLCCRCSPSPVTKSWSDLIPGYDGPDTTPEYQSGADWFDQQSASVQKQILGNAKYAAYQDGLFGLSDLIGKSHSEDWGTSLREKSLSDVIGAKQAQKYYQKAS